MEMKDQLKKPIILLLVASICLTFLTTFSHGQTNAIGPTGTSESMDASISLSNPGGLAAPTLVENLEIVFINATSLPLNVSMPAFNDHFVSARFSIVSGQGVPVFWVFLRVSYDDTLSPAEAQAHASDVFGEFRKVFTLPMSVTNTTSTLNNETATIDIYYKLNDIEDTVEPFEELTKYSPREGFGQLINADLLSKYIPGTSNMALHDIEYRLARTDQTFVWQFSLLLAYWKDYENEGYVNVSLNELLNHSGPIIPSTLRASQVKIDIREEGGSSSRPFVLSLTTCSPSYTSIEKDNGYFTLTYDLTDAVDDIVARISIAPASGFNLTLVAISGAAICTVMVAVFVFVRRRRKKPHQ